MRLLALAVLTTFALSCSSGATSSAANLRGAHDIVIVDKLLFTTSTDKDELRVLDLEPPDLIVGARAYLRAPNPLEALAIPVLSRPSALARDLRYDDVKDAMGAVTVAQGKERGGPWVYARRAGGSEISVVGGGPVSDPSQLSEVKRIPTGAIVTAFAGSGRSPAPSRLYFATTDGSVATIHALDLPATPAGLKALSDAQLAKDQKVLATLQPGDVVVDLIIAPPIAGRGICETTECLVLATRRNQGRGGDVLLFDPATRATRLLDFGGPVRQLAVHAATRNAGTLVPAGQRVFAIRDEEKCGSSECGGVLAVDTFTGQLALDLAGLPMLPIQTGTSLPASLAVAAGGQLLLPAHLVQGADAPTPVVLPALGIITTATGAIVFFDANALTHFDTSQAITQASPLNVGLYTPEGILAPIGTYVTDGSKGGPVFDKDGKGIVLGNGAWKSESIDIVVRGFLPGVTDLPIPDTNPNLLAILDAGAIARVRVGDTAVIRAGNTLCSTPVTGVGSSSIVVDPLACLDDKGKRQRFAVRAGGDDPFVVTGTLSGYLGRTGPGKTFSHKGSYFQRSAPCEPPPMAPKPGCFDPNAPTLSVTLGPANPALTEDWRWTIDVQPNIDNFSLAISSAALLCSTNVAGTVLYDFDRHRVFYTLPSANAVVDLGPRDASPGRLLETAPATCYP